MGGGGGGGGDTPPPAENSRVLQVMAGATLTDAGTTWSKAGSTGLSSSTDPGASGTTLVGSWDATAAGATAGWSAVMAGSPTASAYLAVAVDVDGNFGSPLTSVDTDGGSPATGTLTAFTADTGTPTAPSHIQTVTDHAMFNVFDFIADGPGGHILFVACVLGDTPPTITDNGGMVLTPLCDPVAYTGGTLSAWTAPLPADLAVDAVVHLSATIDAGFAVFLPPA